MRIAVFSMAPVFPAAVHDGSQKVLRTVSAGLGGRGHDLTILCTRRDDNQHSFELAPGVRVEPTLRYRQTYPEPHRTAPQHLADVTTRLHAAVAAADVFYVHGGKLLFHAVFEATPTAVAILDLVYPDTLAAAFSFRRDRLIVPSEYLRQCALAGMSHLTGLAPHVITAASGFDTTALRPARTAALRRRIGLPDDTIAVLWPHRPDPQKGLLEAVRAVAAAREHVEAATAARMRLLVPRWKGSDVAKTAGREYEALFSKAQRYAADLGAPDLLHAHAWVDTPELPAYYSLGTVTLCIGSYIESFGNVSVESLLCGTPAVVARVGAHRTILPDDLVDKVDYGDADAAATAVAHHVSGGTRAAREDVAAYVDAHYPLTAMLDDYERAITTVERIDPLPLAPLAKPGPGDVLVLPPWCALTASGVYDDYASDYHRDARLADIAARAQAGVTVAELLAEGLEEAALDDWVSAGALLRRPAR